MKLLTITSLILAITFVASQSRWYDVKSLEEEDAAGLRGMKYNETQPHVESKTSLKGKRIGIIASHCFEEVEVTYPYIYLTNRGAQVEILGPWWVTDRKIAACEFVRVTKFVPMDLSFTDAVKKNVTYDLLVVAGGVWSSTVVRNDGDAITLIQNQYNSGRLLSTLCSGTTVLINAGLAKNKNLTGSPAIAIDLKNAGANYLDQPAVRHGNLITGRSPQGNDTLVFSEALRDALITKN
jgi:protease I